MPLNIINKMTAKCYLDELVDQFEEGSHPEDIQVEVKSHLSEFIKFGADIKQVVMLMNPHDVFENYGALTKALAKTGVKITPDWLAMKLDDNFVYAHLSELNAIGVSMDKVFLAKCKEAFLDECNGDFDHDTELCKKFFSIGVSVPAVFKAYDSFMDPEEYDSYSFEEALPFLQFFVESGMKKSLAADWLSKRLRSGGRYASDLLDSDVLDGIRSFGLNPEDFIVDYVRANLNDGYEPWDLFEFNKADRTGIPDLLDKIMAALVKLGHLESNTIFEFLYAGGHYETIADAPLGDDVRKEALESLDPDFDPDED